MRFRSNLMLLICVAIHSPSTHANVSSLPKVRHRHASALSVAFGMFGGSGRLPRIPSSPSSRDRQAIESVKAAISSPKDPAFPLIECEFPPLQALNKLGDGSLRSALEVDQANIDFASKLLQSIAPLPLIGPKLWLLASSTASASFLAKAKSRLRGRNVQSLHDGIPNLGPGDICVFLSPSSRSDYLAAQSVASGGNAAVLLNGFAKDAKSVPAKATMAYFEKPLTYNSQVAGYLLRAFPSKWTVVDAVSKDILGTYDDISILVRGTNTPDLRASGRLVQKSVDERAIRARQG